MEVECTIVAVFQSVVEIARHKNVMKLIQRIRVQLQTAHVNKTFNKTTTIAKWTQ